MTLNRPNMLNVYNIQMRDDLSQVLRAISDDPEVLVALFKGAGEKAFCAGADLSEFLTSESPVEARKVRWERDIWGLFLNIPQPTVAALHGYVLGSGIEMALCCDIRITADDARFGLPEVGLGIIPGAGGTQTLPRTVGQAKAMQMLLTNRWVDAQEAWSLGLVNEVVSKSFLQERVREITQSICSLDPLALRYAKEAVRRGSGLTLSQGLDLEKQLASRLYHRVYQLEKQQKK